jgi:signal transduction histidine kinase
VPHVFTGGGNGGSSINYLRRSPRLRRCSAIGRKHDINAVRKPWRLGGRSHQAGRRLPPVSADALVLRRVIENLVNNRRRSWTERAAPRCQRNGEGNVRLAVSDTGRGMSKAELDRAFDDFYTTKSGGTGLGLSIVRRLVLDSNGSMKVETEPGQGSTFIVEIPVL